MVRLTVIFLLFVSSICQADQYLCITNKATGFDFNEQSNDWETTSFKTADHKYIISQVVESEENPYKGKKYMVVKMGKSTPSFLCESDIDSDGFLFCEAYGTCGGFRFNKTNGRFILHFMIGYYNVLPDLNGITDKTSDTPFIEIGTCSPF